MIKMCDETLLRPLSIIFRNSSKSSIYPSTWKKANVIPDHKKDDKQCVNNYRPVSLIPVLGKIFEKLIFDEIYFFLIGKNFSIQTNLVFDQLIHV